MNQEMLFDENDVCKLCGDTTGYRSHTDECPGPVIETMKFFGYLEMSEGARGHYSYREELIESATVESLLDAAAESAKRWDNHTLRVFVGSEEALNNGDGKLFDRMLSERVRKLIYKDEYKFRMREYESAMAKWKQERDALTASASDYSTEGFNRRWAELQAKMPKEPTKPQG